MGIEQLFHLLPQCQIVESFAIEHLAAGGGIGELQGR
jgi:hypothetical protein